MKRRRPIKAGDRHGRLTAIEPVPRSRGRWLFLCDCGTIKAADSSKVRMGDTRSCGCLQREVVRHGEASAVAKLSEAKVREARADRSRGVSVTSIALRFGVDRSSIYRCCSGATWAHVDAG